MPPKKKRKHEFIKGEWKKGRRNHKKKQDREKRERGDGNERGAGYKIIVKENELFVKFYKDLGLIPPEEWDTFMATMRESLPATFRITGTRLLAEHVRTCLEKKFFGHLSQIEVEGETVPPPKPLTWYPDNLAWHVPLTKKFIRKSPLMSKFHAFLVKENEQGNISRQEAVSMIPPLLLDVKSHHKVLDMCAAPGSKTAQLIEALHAEDTENSAIPGGVVIANDADNKRCYMLVHQAKRLNSPCFMVTNHDASVFPMFYYHDEDDVRHPLHYDRVLCDVPCSGDGTLRKNPTIWRQWNPSVGQSLHKLQLRILTRGLELLAPRGRLVYSTCSMNPVENEAVIATMLGLCKGAVELLDCSDSLPGLKRIPGLIKWKIMTKEGEWVPGKDDVPEAAKSYLTSTMFPPEDKDCKELVKCMRVLPHHQDSGGFFIALLQKNNWLPWQKQRKQAPFVPNPSPQTTELLSTLPESVSPSDEPQVTPCDTVSEIETAKKSQETIVTSQDATSLESVLAPSSQDISQETSIDSQDTPTLLKESTVPTQDISQDTTDPTQETKPSSIDSDIVPSPHNTSKDSHLQERDLKKETEEERPSKSVIGRPSFQQRRSRGFKEDPYVFLTKNSDVQQAIESYYGVPESFPYEQLLTRSLVGRKRNVYLASSLVKELTIRNEHVVKIINIGVRVLSRYDHQRTACTFRICQEGVDTMLPYITVHTVPVTQEDLVTLLSQANPLTSTLSQTAQQALHPLGVGPVLFKFTPCKQTGDPGSCSSASTYEGYVLSCPISLSGWLAAKSARLFVDKNSRYHFLYMLGHEPPENQSLVNVTAAARRQQEEDEIEGNDGEDVSQTESETQLVEREESMLELNEVFEVGLKSETGKNERPDYDDS